MGKRINDGCSCMATRDQEDDLTQTSRVTQTSREQGRKERVFKKCGQAVQRLFQMAVQSSSSAVSLLSTVIAQST
ncbi:unnamed protein product [Lasius platythorax]|uniref:Uncharacterized protein n=1 Tax=Lasius platythorax TaxID=488582 RepID=A0AAV2P0K9_9HYME